MSEPSISERLKLFKKLHEGGIQIPDDKLAELRAGGFVPMDGIQMAKPRVVHNENAPEGWPEWLSYTGDITVEDSEWRPKSRVQHTEEFIQWVNSFLYNSFEFIGYYEPFEKYCQQAYLWEVGMGIIPESTSSDARKDYILSEYNKCDRNTLFFANRFGYLKEGDDDEGRVKYRAKHHHAVILYLLDCGYSTMFGKGRQIGCTSAIGLWALKCILFRPNFYIKFVTEDDTTGKEIFRDKIKYPFTELPPRFKFTVKGDSQSQLWLTSKREKGGKGYPNSRVDVVAPSPTAINGGSPQVTIVDEIGNIALLGEMINEARPTLYWNNPVTGQFEMKRQVVMLGTGGKMDKGKGAYEREWYRILSLWEEKNFQAGIIPLFFDWSVRLSRADYMKEKDYYYGGHRSSELGIDLEASKIQFHQHYPSSYRDMFRSSTDTLVSQDIIGTGLTRCRALSAIERPVYGYFEPIYDESNPQPETSDVPFAIIGSRFIPVSDDDMAKATAIMQRAPVTTWRHRYYQGNDPILGESGVSNFASSIWDDQFCEISCIVNFRKKHDHKAAFLQAMLMGLYYDTDHVEGKKVGVPDLTENNLGANYMDYKEAKGYRNSLVYNAQLPPKFRGGGSLLGIDNKGVRNASIISEIEELFKIYHQNINIETLFVQLDTFTRNVSNTGKEVWGPKNKKINRDDTLFSSGYSYLCRKCFPERFPYEEQKSVVGFKLQYALIRNQDGSLSRIPKRVPVLQKKKDSNAVNPV